MKRVQSDDSLKTCIEREHLVSNNFTIHENDFYQTVIARFPQRAAVKQPKWVYSKIREVISFYQSINVPFAFRWMKST